MNAPIPLVLDFVEWIAAKPRKRAEVMDAWRTSCPRLTVWEDTVEQKLVAFKSSNGNGALVSITDEGRRFLLMHGRTARPRGRFGRPPAAMRQAERVR